MYSKRRNERKKILMVKKLVQQEKGCEEEDHDCEEVYNKRRKESDLDGCEKAYRKRGANF